MGSLTAHLVGLCRFPQLGQDETTTPLRGSIHLKNLCRDHREVRKLRHPFQQASQLRFLPAVYLEAQLLRASVDRSCLANSGGSGDEQSVTHVLSFLGVQLSTVPV